MKEGIVVASKHHFSTFEKYEKLAKLFSQQKNIVSQLNLENYTRLIDHLTKVAVPELAIEEAVVRQVRMLETFNTRIYEQHVVLDALVSQWDTLARIAGAYKTKEIVVLEKALLRNEFKALQRFADTLRVAKHIEAPNVALLKMAHAFEGVTLPKGMTTILNQMHVGTAKVLANSESLSYDAISRRLFVERSPENTATISETNILCASMQVLSGIDEADLISFLNYLEKYPPYASTHIIGKQINDIIASWDRLIDFDCENYYHARALREGSCPYTESELLQAPHGVTWHGRFNYIGQSHFYFSDVPRGALLEVTKHSKEKKVQIARIRPIRAIRMIDLSGEIETQNKFLEYCRFKPAPNEHPYIKREYLLPCYVANCCEMHGIEGIKYYGSREYSNYVSWNDAYFKLVDSEIQYV